MLSGGKPLQPAWTTVKLVGRRLFPIWKYITFKGLQILLYIALYIAGDWIENPEGAEVFYRIVLPKFTFEYVLSVAIHALVF